MEQNNWKKGFVWICLPNRQMVTKAGLSMGSDHLFGVVNSNHFENNFSRTLVSFSLSAERWLFTCFLHTFYGSTRKHKKRQPKHYFRRYNYQRLKPNLLMIPTKRKQLSVKHMARNICAISFREKFIIKNRKPPKHEINLNSLLAVLSPQNKFPAPPGTFSDLLSYFSDSEVSSSMR